MMIIILVVVHSGILSSQTSGARGGCGVGWGGGVDSFLTVFMQPPSLFVRATHTDVYYNVSSDYYNDSSSIERIVSSSG